MSYIKEQLPYTLDAFEGEELELKKKNYQRCDK